MTPQPSPPRLQQYREALLRLRRAHDGDIEDLQADAFSEESPRLSVDNPADTGTDSFSQTFSLELLARDTAILEEILDALQRLDADEFGRCESCRRWIQKARLDAVPFARLCIGCQRAAEEKR